MINETAARPAEAAWLAESVVTPRQSASRTALAGLIGNVIEWFDFAVYGYFVTTAAKVALGTLVERMEDEIHADSSVIVGRSEIGAWCQI